MPTKREMTDQHEHQWTPRYDTENEYFCSVCGDDKPGTYKTSKLPPEEPEQLVSQEWIERIIREYPGEWNTTKAAREIQHRHALAARRGGR